MTQSLVDLLESFNRKERFFLIEAALGEGCFKLCSEFRTNLEKVFRLRIPEQAFVAIDYHLDWIVAALSLWQAGTSSQTVFPNQDKRLEAKQEDIDMFVVFEAEGMTHLLLLEAKAETSWTNKQMSSKADRLEKVFGDSGKAIEGVRPHFALLSPSEPTRKLEVHKWPTWMVSNGKPIYIELKVHPNRRQAKRCDANGKVTKKGKHFVVQGP